ncbi:hypothetical protein niasHS_002802 [Heterodera schachtii]|uniref:Uncharacterized protein n=1 Tax=Heterodera schachtii TaxID=97005 RepID=A0ABD2K2H5_HETSC
MSIKQEIDLLPKDETQEEPPLDSLVHCTEKLKKVVFPFPEIKHLRKHATIRQCLVGCLAACKWKLTETVIVDEVIFLDQTYVMFKHSETRYLFDNLDYVHITDKVFRQWIDELVMRDEPLPLYALYFDRKINLLKMWKELKEIGFFDKTEQPKNDGGTNLQMELEKQFGIGTQHIMVTPWHLVQLLQLSRREFEHVVVGLYVCCVFTVRGEERYFIERIRKVSWGAVPYEMYGQKLSILLHFESHNAGPCPVFAVQFPSPEIDQELVQNRQAAYEFIPPTDRHIVRKRRRLQEALDNCMKRGNLLLNETDKNCFNRTCSF